MYLRQDNSDKVNKYSGWDGRTMMTLQGKHLLIVEDNSLNRVVYQITLGTQGARLDFDRWGRKTVDKLKGSADWDLIILDLMLQGGTSGFDIFQQIRALPEYDQIPIIAVSASEPSIAMPRVRELGFSGFISKPIDEDCFADRIAKVIKGEQIWYDGTLYKL